jgi:hypothetical protein
MPGASVQSGSTDNGDASMNDSAPVEAAEDVSDTQPVTLPSQGSLYWYVGDVFAAHAAFLCCE